MSRGVHWLFVGSIVLVTLAGCGRGLFYFAEREPWRREAEVACLNSGGVKEGAGIVRIEPINGPGACGAHYPLRVTAFGEFAALGFASETVRPPGSIPGASQPRWPIAQSPYAGPAPMTPPVQIGQPMPLHAPGVMPMVSTPQTYHPQPQQLAPSRGPQRAAAIAPVEVRPTATLACPIVSALDRWIDNAVQPAAQKWFGRPVSEIVQISAYSCRGMNSQPGARISEHAFGNALDIAGFVLADGYRITVKDGWRGSPEQQGFLRDVQGAACDQFTTVLAPGSDSFHYDHIHVDLMRRDSGRRICQPGAVDGEQIAARARKSPMLAGRNAEPPPLRRYDQPFDASNDPFAWRGDVQRRDPASTGSLGWQQPGTRNLVAEDRDWVEDPGPRPAVDWARNRHNVQ
jgi:hypothetical protein